MTQGLYSYGGILTTHEPTKTISKSIYGWRWAANENEALGSILKALKDKWPEWDVSVLDATEIPADHLTRPSDGKP